MQAIYKPIASCVCAPWLGQGLVFGGAAVDDEERAAQL
jgi:hypothetical protein